LDQRRQHPNYQSRRGEFFSEGCEGWVPIAADVLAEIIRFQRLTTDRTLSRVEIRQTATKLSIGGTPSG